MEDQPMVVDDLLSSPTKSDAMVGVTEENEYDDNDNDELDEATTMIQSPPRTASASASASEFLEKGHDEHQDALIYPQEPRFAVDDKVLCPHGSSPTSSGGNNDAATMLYPSVVRKVRFSAAAAAGSDNHHDHSAAGQWEFLVHFVGWHARYDKWMRPGDLVVDTPEARAANEARMPPPPGAPQTLSSSSSRKRKKDRAVELAAEGGAADAVTNEQGGSADSNTRAKAHKRSSTTAVPTTAASRGSLPFEEYCELPLTLKTVLWDEWERLNPRDYLFHNPDNNNNHEENGATTAPAAGVVRTRLPTRVVHDLPSKATVRYVVSHFGKTATQKCRESNHQIEGSGPAAPSNGGSGTHPSGATPDQIQEFCTGLLQLFETALPICLLYPQERPQYEALLAEHRRKRSEDGRSEASPPLQLSAVYGCEHLLRLLVRLPVLLQGESQPNSSNTSTSNSKRPVGGGQQPRHKWMGPLLSELVLLLQKNRSQIFSKSSYRPPHVPHEYLEWERDLYGMNA
jgi:MRG